MTVSATDHVWMYYEYRDQQGTVLKGDAHNLNCMAHGSQHYWVEYRDGNDPKWDNYHKARAEEYMVKDGYYILKDYSTHDSYHKDAKEDYESVRKWLYNKYPDCNCTITEYKERHGKKDYQIVELKFPNSWYDTNMKLWVYATHIYVE